MVVAAVILGSLPPLLENALANVIVTVGFIFLAFIVCLARGPRETGWVGWSGGWAIRRDDRPAEAGESDPETSVGSVVVVEGCGEGHGHKDK